MAPYMARADSGRMAGLVIDNDGTIQFPLVGSVPVAGKTAEQAPCNFCRRSWPCTSKSPR
jgi:protein involved in polysaccharide export with SLBB domain